MGADSRDLVLGLQLLMLVLDIAFNALDVLLYRDSMALLMISILQATNLVLSIIVLVICFSSTFVFQAGLIGHLLRQVWPTLAVSLSYLIASIALHMLCLSSRWRDANYVPWTNQFLASLYCFQKINAIFFYAFYKRSAFLLTDPRLHSDNQWLRDQIRSQFK